MERFSYAITTFEHAIERARQMVKLYDALVALRPREPANDDALRSAYFQTVSSFDFFAHELAAVEAKYRFSNAIRTKNISLPMDIMMILDKEERISAAEQCIRQINSYKAFVDPGKLAEALSCYCEKPWIKICELMNKEKSEADRRTAEQIKGQLKNIWRRRNQIAHAADVNPALAGIELWPIDKEDTEITINFIKEIGGTLPYVISDSAFSERESIMDCVPN
ncbi:HEPN domain-containing protein [Azospirillum tabaci]|uniref:HEPN domain-containing protein n=1 Tax=Azospirillum tabaci TaxID=2752310 RepID=UPI001660662C|nr:HEPN domain-containing protein [Azospirillum tabaci]